MKKSAKLALVLLAVVAGGVIAFAGAKPEGFRSAGDVLADPDAYEGREVQLKTTVLDGSLDRSGDALAFAVGDGDGTRLPVVWSSLRPVPEHEAGGTLEGRTVVLTGEVARAEDGAWVFRATDMQVGCASKYEPAESGE